MPLYPGSGPGGLAVLVDEEFLEAVWKVVHLPDNQDFAVVIDCDGGT